MFTLKLIDKKSTSNQLAITFFLPINDFRVSSLIMFIFICLLARKYFPIWRELIIASFLSLMAMLVPVLNIIFLSISSALIVMITMPFFERIIPKRDLLAHKLWAFLKDLGIVTYFLELYYKYFMQKKENFYIQTFLIYFFCILYFIISKYLLLNKNVINSVSLSFLYTVFFALILGFLAFYLRFLLNLSIIIKDLEPMFHVQTEGFENEPNTGSTKPKPETTSSKSLFSYHRHHHNHNYNYDALRAARNATLFKRLGFGVGLCGLGIAGYAAYQQGLQTYHTAREADVAAFDAGLITKETYYQRHPEDLSKPSKDQLKK